MGSPAFPGIDPNQVALIRSIMQASQGDSSGIPAAPSPALAPTSPLPATSPFDLPSIVKQISGMPEYKSQSDKLTQIGGQEEALRQQMAAEPIPKMGFQPNFQKGHFLHNLGQALLAFAASTRPGQAVQDTVYGPGIDRYQAKQKNLAAQLATLKDQEAVPTEQLRAMTGLTGAASMGSYRAGELDVRRQRNDIAKKNSDTQAQRVANEHANDLTRQAQGWQRLSQQDREIQQRQWFEQAIVNVQKERIAAGMDENSARIQAQEDVRAAMAQNSYVQAHPWLSMMGMTPDLTSAPGAQTPKEIGAPAAPKPAAKPKGKKNVIVVSPEDMK